MFTSARSTSLTAVAVLAAIAVVFFFQGGFSSSRQPKETEADSAPAGQSAAQSASQSAATPLARDERLSVLFPRTEEFDFEAPEPGTYKLPTIKQAGDGTVLDIAGQATTLRQEFAGKITLLSFIYTRCSDTHGCPLATALLFDIFDVSQRSPRLAQNTKLITVSFDPARDDPQAMRDYGAPALNDQDRAKKMPWSFLTTATRDDLQPILESYGQAVSIATDSDTLKHVLRMYLIDRQGRVRNVYGLGFMDPRLLLADVETLLIEEAQKGGS